MTDGSLNFAFTQIYLTKKKTFYSNYATVFFFAKNEINNSIYFYHIVCEYPIFNVIIGYDIKTKRVYSGGLWFMI